MEFNNQAPLTYLSPKTEIMTDLMKDDSFYILLQAFLSLLTASIDFLYIIILSGRTASCFLWKSSGLRDIGQV